jgi:hypothetical protein
MLGAGATLVVLLGFFTALSKPEKAADIATKIEPTAGTIHDRYQGTTGATVRR